MTADELQIAPGSLPHLPWDPDALGTLLETIPRTGSQDTVAGNVRRRPGA